MPDFVIGTKAGRFVAPVKEEGFNKIVKVLPLGGGFNLEGQK